MNLLILGGTRFLGRAVVRSAQARGHDITLFNRGRSNPALFPEVERLVGDRAVDLSPVLNTNQAESCILAELQDPNRLVTEVGYTQSERSTLAVSAVPVTGRGRIA